MYELLELIIQIAIFHEHNDILRQINEHLQNS